MTLRPKFFPWRKAWCKRTMRKLVVVVCNPLQAIPHMRGRCGHAEAMNYRMTSCELSNKVSIAIIVELHF